MKTKSGEKTSAASKSLPRRPIIWIHWNSPFQTLLYLINILTIDRTALNFASLPYIRISQLHDFWRGTFTIVLTRYLRFLTTKVFHSLRAWIMGNGKHSRETGLQQDQMMSSWPWLSICGEFFKNGVLVFLKLQFQSSFFDNFIIPFFFLNFRRL